MSSSEKNDSNENTISKESTEELQTNKTSQTIKFMSIPQSAKTVQRNMSIMPTMVPKAEIIKCNSETAKTINSRCLSQSDEVPVYKS